MSLNILLIPLFIFIIIFVLLASSAFFHVVRFELLSATSITMTAIFIGGAFLIGSISTRYIMDIDWSKKITLSPYAAPYNGEDTQKDTLNILTF